MADRQTALDVLRDLMMQGFAGLDQYDDSRFVVEAPEPFLSAAETALDDLGAYFLKSGPIGVRPTHVAVLLSQRVRTELGLDGPDVPKIAVALASRRVPA